MKSVEINHIKSQIEKKIGKKVCVRIALGRHRIGMHEGIIAQTYPDVFIISIKEDPKKRNSPVKIMSFQYSDILTKRIQLKLL